MDKIGVFCSSSERMESVYYEQTELLGRWMGEHGKTLVYGGSRCGLMEAVAASVKKSGGRVFGVVPRKVVQNDMVSEHIDVVFHADDLRDRKQWLIDESDIMVALPGSVGTLDEAFSAMAENTFGMHSKKIIFWNINGFWDDLFLMIDRMEGKGVVNKPFSEFMLRADTLQQVIEFIDK
ncbi:MAG: TIGR00730 family Rossman fold protein [Bacteroides sp.]|nr:TIGR00730 family Rossman fold protein [Roseburia sp.]MCM1347334.1 TIGR00730 family Rossman fold protein [Bacteroides sp.]MCM1421814.1 TIGR00730 family Rossman fold protein [Bacteroides sp.]